MTDAPGPTPPPQDPRGLSSEQARAQWALDGPNELSPPRHRTLWHIVAEVLREPMLQLLLAAGAIYWVLGDRGEAAVLLGFVLITIGITVRQAQRAERVLEALRDLTSPRALVIRDGTPRRIAGREVVVGDLLVLSEGDRVPADATLQSAHDLQVDESLLTGESVPVDKAVGDDAAARVSAGTVVVRGQGLARVHATGARSDIGRIGVSLGTIEAPPTPLTVQTHRMVRLFSVFGLSLSVAVVLAWGLARGQWLDGVLAGIALAMAMLPEEFTLILTVFMAMGAWRLSHAHVLSRRAAAIEALGAATVLCADKTGTLTRNRMRVAHLVGPDPARLLATAALACEREPFDPMEQAILEKADRSSVPSEWTLVHEYGLGPDCLAMTHVWQAGPEASCGFEVATKGAVESVVRLCHLQADAAAAVERDAHALAAGGSRVLGVARAHWPDAPWPDDPHAFRFEFAGLVALEDPLRDGVAEAVAECRSAGVRVLMITGDHPATARAIASQAGLDGTGEVLTGAQLAALGDEPLREAVQRTQVFARVPPALKLRIVEALQARGEVVAMTGDGVNDAPALKAAHIGIAMGGRGTDVAREASALVLLDDAFGSIVKAIRLGRRIDDNLRKAMAFVVAVHVPIAGLTLLPLLVGWPPLLTPVHIAFLELLIDPVCSIAFEAEAEEADVMRRPPRAPGAPLFSAGLLAWSVGLGGVALALVAGLYGTLLARAQVPQALAATLSFFALVGASVALIVVHRSAGGRATWTRLLLPNRTLWQVTGAALGLLALTVLVAPLRHAFGFASPPLPQALLAVGAGLALLLPMALAVRWRRA